MFAAACVALALMGPEWPSPDPHYTLDVRNAPTAAVFAMMLDGGWSTNVYVTRHFPARVDLKLTEVQVTLPPPSSGRGYGDDWPIGGWILGMQRAMGVQGLAVGYEREGGSFYVSRTDQPATVASEEYPRDAHDSWHRLDATGPGALTSLPADVSRSGLRLAAVRWEPAADLRRAILVARSAGGVTFTRVVRKGDPVGTGGYRVGEIESSAISLTDSPLGPIRLMLRSDKPGRD